MHELGLPKIQEGAAGNAVGTFWVTPALDPTTETRSSAYTAYYAPVSNRPNFHLMTGSQAIEILFSDKTTIGVKVKSRTDGSITSYYASKEIVMAAGAIHTPQLLQLSGIGPKSVLDAAGIPVKIDMSSIGANFQDHPVSYLRFNCRLFMRHLHFTELLKAFAVTNDTFPNPNSLSTNTTFNQTSYNEYLANRTGPYTEAHANSAAWLSLEQIAPGTASSLISSASAQEDPSSYLPAAYSDLSLLAGFLAQRKILTDRFTAGTVAVYEFPFNGGGFVPNAIQKPLSRGTVYLNASNPMGEPVVTYNTFQNPFDAAVMYAAVNFTRTFFLNTTAMARLGPVELLPGPNAIRQDEVLSALTKAGSLNPSFAHPSGSCAMMPQGLGGCVGSDLKVHGVEGLRIVDASILPMIPAAHLQATMYAVGEKAADLMKAG